MKKFKQKLKLILLLKLPYKRYVFKCFGLVIYVFLILTVFHFNIGKFTGIENLLNYFVKKENINNIDENLNQNYL